MPKKPFPSIDRDSAAEAIRQMSENDLRYLNRLIVGRLKLISQARSTALLADFDIGQRVRFQSPAGEDKEGLIIRINKKTASISTDDGEHWNVHPGFLRPAESSHDIQRR